MDISRCYDAQGNVITHFTQWDYGLQIYFSGDYGDNYVYVDFCNDNSTESYRVVPTIDDDGRYCAEVPNILLQEAITLYAFVVVSNGDDSVVTKFVFVIPIYEKIKPNDYEYKDNLDVVSLIELQKEMKELMELFTSQEEERIANENERIENEEEREDNEAQRQANEEERQENEEERIANEEQRKEDHEQCKEATDAANEAAENANEAAEEARAAAKGDFEVEFEEAEVFENIESGEDLSTMFGKIQKFFDDPITDEEIDYLFDQYKETWFADEYVVDETMLPDNDRATGLLGECVVGEAVCGVESST